MITYIFVSVCCFQRLLRPAARQYDMRRDGREQLAARRRRTRGASITCSYAQLERLACSVSGTGCLGNLVGLQAGILTSAERARLSELYPLSTALQPTHSRRLCLPCSTSCVCTCLFIYPAEPAMLRLQGRSSSLSAVALCWASIGGILDVSCTSYLSALLKPPALSTSSVVPLPPGLAPPTVTNSPSSASSPRASPFPLPEFIDTIITPGRRRLLVDPASRLSLAGRSCLAHQLLLVSPSRRSLSAAPATTSFVSHRSTCFDQ